MHAECTFSKKDRNCTLFISTTGWVFDAYDIVLFSLLSIYILPSLSITSSLYSIIFGAQLASTAIGGVLFGILADKLGKREALALDFVVYSLACLLIFFSYDWVSLLFARVLAGLAIGGEWGISSSLLNDVLGSEHRGLGFGILQSGWSIGVGCAALSAIFVAQRVGWRYSFLIGMLALFLAGYVYFYVPHIPPKLHSLRKALKSVPMRKLAIGLSVAILGMYAFYLVWTWLPKELVNSGILSSEQLFLFIGLSAFTNGFGHIFFGISLLTAVGIAALAIVFSALLYQYL